MAERTHKPRATTAQKTAQPTRRGTADRSAPVQKLGALQRLADEAVLQGVFAPHLVGANAHLRNNAAWGNKIGRRINAGDEVVADPADSQTQIIPRRFRDNRTVDWTKAVDETGETWNNAAHGGAATYIRNASLGAPVDYTAKHHKPTAGLTTRNIGPEPRWDVNAGAYEIYEESLSHPGHQIVRKGDALRRLDPIAMTYTALDADETRQMNRNALRQHLIDRTKNILTAASAGQPWQAEFIKDENVARLVSDADGSKALRLNEGLMMGGEPFVNWYRWLAGPFARIQTGAVFTRNAFNYWRDYVSGGNPDHVTMPQINLTGSDLHQEGLGAIIVRFNKHAAEGPAPYTGQTNFEVIIKSERKELEKALFGTEANSLANRVNTDLHLDAAEAITTFHMVTSANRGTMIEMVRDAAQRGLGDAPSDPTAAFYEAMTFAFMTGMSDLHYENVLWGDDGRPYFIDADNALNQGRMEFNLDPMARNQSGMAAFNRDASTNVLGQIENALNGIENEDPYGSKILRALQEDDPDAVIPVIPLVRAAFAGKSGRVVPISTGAWGGELRNRYIAYPEGAFTDARDARTRWGIAEKMSHKLTNPDPPQPGLEGETGKTGSGNYNRLVEKLQIKTDLDKGQIPFYVYHYDSGEVHHNVPRVWTGRSLADAIESLLTSFPGQR